MLYEVQGDILLSEAQVIAHGVAPNDHFENGLALALRTKFPDMYKDFKHHNHVKSLKEGEILSYALPDGRYIVSLATQAPAPSEHAHPGKASLANVNHALHALARWLGENKIKSLALPRLATGVGGLAWPEVQVLIQKLLGDLSTPVFVYNTFHSGQKANEPLV